MFWIELYLNLASPQQCAALKKVKRDLYEKLTIRYWFYLSCYQSIFVNLIGCTKGFSFNPISIFVLFKIHKALHFVHPWPDFVLGDSTCEFQVHLRNILTEFRFESPISISKWNNWLDFRRESENYFKVKIFSDSRPKSAQKLILKVFSDFETQIIFRLSKFFEFLNSMVYMC